MIVNLNQAEMIQSLKLQTKHQFKYNTPDSWRILEIQMLFKSSLMIMNANKPSRKTLRRDKIN